MHVPFLIPTPHCVQVARDPAAAQRLADTRRLIAPQLTAGDRLRLYDLRHTHASLLIHEGVHPKKISEWLGHSSIKLTMDTYGHLLEGSDRDSAEKMEKLLGGEPKAPRALTMPTETKLLTKKPKPASCGLLSD